MGLLRYSSESSPRILGVPRYLIYLLLSIAVVALVVPLAVMFGQKESSTPLSDILVPLYVYPSPGAWDPLFTAIERHPSLTFVVVVNPASGPGSGASPDGNYTREIPRLNSFANVRTVGYVSTAWAKREVSLALHDIETYSSWARNSSVRNLGVQGIFLDETPATYSEASAQFLGTLASAVRSATGFGGDPLIVHNPGTIPDARYLSYCNMTVLFEGTYSTYQIHHFRKIISNFSSSAKCSREAIACIVHDLPATLTSKEEFGLIKDLRGVAGGIFVTGLATDYYASFWDGWAGFVVDMNV